MKNQARKILPLFLASVILLWFVGCTSHEDEPESWEGDLCLLLRVSVLDQNGTRSRGVSRANDYDFELPVQDCELLHSLRVIIIEKGGDRKIVHNKFTPLTKAASSIISGLRFQVDFDTEYDIYLIGNEKGLIGVDTEQLFDRDLAESKTYPNHNPLENLIISASGIAQPIIDNTGTTKTLVPMSEKFRVTTIERPLGPESVKIEMSKDLFLTRGASKFSFNFYRSADYKGDNKLQIKKIRISGLGTEEYMLPNETIYDPGQYETSNNKYGGRIVTEFSTPENNAIGNYDFILPESIIVNNFPVAGSAGNTVSYSPDLYFPESLGNNGFECSISFDGEDFLKPVKLPNLDKLPRNTHAIINITIGNNNALLLTVQVLPWTPQYVEFDYSDNIGMAEDGTLTFEQNSYAELNKSTGRLILNDYPNAAIGTFGISSPLNAQWHAYLITTAGELGAIKFVVTDDEGNTSYSSSISGIIDGKKTSFKVAAIQSAGSQPRAARLQVIVTLASGLSIPVNILKSTEYGVGIENITFIQNPQ